MYNKAKRRWCKHRQNLICYYKHCPLDSPELRRVIEFFLYCGRTPASPRMDFGGTRHLDKPWMDYRDGMRALKAKIFSEDQMEDYNTWEMTGRISMNREKCRAWRKTLNHVWDCL